MIEQIIGIFLFLVHYLAIEKKRLKRLITMSDISYALVSLSYLLNSQLIGQYAIIFTLTSLIGKIFILKRYFIKDIDDFVVHYFGFLISLYWFTKIKKWNANNKIIIAGGLLITLLHYIYFKTTNLHMYRSSPLNTTNGILKYVLMFAMIIVINKSIKYYFKK